jgi:hypothetical protein
MSIKAWASFGLGYLAGKSGEKKRLREELEAARDEFEALTETGADEDAIERARKRVVDLEKRSR